MCIKLKFNIHLIMALHNNCDQDNSPGINKKAWALCRIRAVQTTNENGKTNPDNSQLVKQLAVPNPF